MGERKVHPTLITNNQLREVITEIHKEVSEYEFPLPCKNIKAEDLHQIGTSEIGYHSKKLIVSIDIPLLKRKFY